MLGFRHRLAFSRKLLILHGERFDNEYKLFFMMLSIAT